MSSQEKSNRITIWKIFSNTSGYYYYFDTKCYDKRGQIRGYIRRQAIATHNENLKLLYSEPDVDVELITNMEYNPVLVDNYMHSLINTNAGLQPANSKCLNISKVVYKKPTVEQIAEKIEQVEQKIAEENYKELEEEQPYKIINTHLLELIKGTNKLIEIKTHLIELVSNAKPLVPEYQIVKYYTNDMYKSYFNHFKSLLGYSTVNTDLDCNSVYKSHIDDKVNEEFRKRGLIKKEQILVENDKSYRDINITNINNCIKKK